MKLTKPKSNYKREYELKYVAVSMDTGNVFDFDPSFQRLFTEIPKAIRERTFFFFVKHGKWEYIKTKI